MRFLAVPKRMYRVGAVAVLCMVFCGGALARNVALLVAVGQFRDPQLKTQQLLGTASDIDSMQAALTSRWAFEPKDVHALRDQEGTRERILQEISGLEDRSAPGDTVVIYFSGHGTSANAENNSFDLPYATGAWVPYDLDYTSSKTANQTLIIGRRDLVPRLKRLDQSGRFVVVMSDSCYSGQVVRAFGETHSRSRFLPMVARDLGVARLQTPVAVRPPPPPYPYQHVVLLSGASDSETGADISSPQALSQAPTLDGKYHGAFTDALLRLLTGQLLPGAFNYAQGREALNGFLEHRNFAQHPQLLPAIAEDPNDVGSNAFLGMHVAMHDTEPSLPPLPTVRTGLRVRFESGPPALRFKLEALEGIQIVQQGADLVVRQQGTQLLLLGPAGDPIATAAPDDPALLKRIAAQAWLNRTLPGGSGTLGLRAETNPGSRGNTYVACESFVFEVKLQKSAYVMLLDLDAQGNLTVLYPTRAAERQLIVGGKAHAIPSDDPQDRIVVEAPFGSDQVAILAFEKMPAFFSDLNDVQRFAVDGVRAAALAKGFNNLDGAVSVQQITVHTYPGSSGSSCK